MKSSTLALLLVPEILPTWDFAILFLTAMSSAETSSPLWDQVFFWGGEASKPLETFEKISLVGFEKGVSVMMELWTTGQNQVSQQTLNMEMVSC